MKIKETLINLDHNIFNEIKSQDKSYLLGWIASNGIIDYDSITISVNSKDDYFLKNLKNILCEIDESDFQPKELSFTISSKTIYNDICNWLNIKENDKSDMCFPDLENDELKWAFLRGIFDSNGVIYNISFKRRQPECKIITYSDSMKKSIIEFTKIPCNKKGLELYWHGNNSLDFLNEIYINSSIYRLPRKYEQYLDLSTWVPSVSYSKYYKNDHCTWSKTRNDAVSPSKERASDSGYDLTLLEKIRTVGKVEFYDTGIKIKPNFGYYFNLVPRSSISKTGYIFANSIGIIDRTYLGNIIVALIKIDELMPDLQLPIRLVQIIPNQIVHFQLTEVDDIDINSTDRGDGGFGSSNK